MTVKIWVPADLDVPEEALSQLAQAVRDQFELEPDAPVYMEDLLVEANRQGLLAELPAEDWRIAEEWTEPLTPQELQKLVTPPTEPAATLLSCPHGETEGAPDDLACSDCDGTVYGNL